jgi:predicted RNase H-like HicB family nuclease
MREAIDLHLQALRDSGEPVPAPRSTSEYVEA